MHRSASIVKKCIAALASYLVGALLFVSLTGELGAQNWRTASRAPAGFAPDPATTPEAVVQVYAARTIDWRGYFGVHTWIAAKPTGAAAFTVYEVFGFQLRRAATAVRISERAADGLWYGNRPQVLSDVRGPGVDAIIARIRTAAAAYPYPGVYHAWPGPNSNTFTAWVLRAVPELRVDLPGTAVGKDFLGWRPVAFSPSGTGAQFNLGGVAGVLVGWEEGVEVNVAGLVFGVNPKRLSLKLPVIGSVGDRANAKPRRIEASVSTAAP
ncbi:MAG: DUF3750 domain-containing protein [Verrucomicrobia bacterium]|nr:DUF3750 domain-containing protein [Verrucomicrobiota bacterium]